MFDFPAPSGRLPEVDFTDAKEDSACLKNFFGLLHGRDIAIQSLVSDEESFYNIIDFVRKYDCSRLLKLLRDEFKLALVERKRSSDWVKAYMIGIHMDDIGICTEAIRQGFAFRKHKALNNDEATVDDFLEGTSFFEVGGMPSVMMDRCPARYTVALMRANRKLAAEGKSDKGDARHIVANEFRRIMLLVSTLPPSTCLNVS